MINIDFRDKRPLYEQICSKLEELILNGVIKANEPLPSVRSLAIELSINPNTIQKAYSIIKQKGLIYSISGRGSFAADTADILPAKKKEIFDELRALFAKAYALGITKEELHQVIEGEENK